MAGYDQLIRPFVESSGLREALVAGILVVIAASVVGTWIVLQGITFLGDALGHGILPGVAIAFVLGGNLQLGALLAAIAMVLGVNALKRTTVLPDDVSIGVLFVGFLATTVVIMSAASGAYIADLNGFLIGSINAIDSADLLRQGGAAALAVIVTIVMYRAFLTMTFDQTQAKLLNLRPEASYLALLGLLAVVVVASFETVGSLLILAFLVAPPASAALLVRRVPLIMFVAVLFGSAAVVVGILVSYHYDTAGAATIAMISVLMFFGAAAFASWQERRSRVGSARAINTMP